MKKATTLETIPKGAWVKVVPVGKWLERVFEYHGDGRLIDTYGKESTVDVTTPATRVFWQAVGSPALELEDDDVFVCDSCDGTGEVAVRVYGNGDSYLDGERPCEECKGYGFLHGYASDGTPCPVEEAPRRAEVCR